ncbi:hypothetical protein V8E36_000022 [Tilletia maclaganii]
MLSAAHASGAATAKPWTSAATSSRHHHHSPEVDLNRIPNSVLTYSITDASSYLADYHPSNILVDDPTNVNSRWAAAYGGTTSPFNNHNIPTGAAASLSTFSGIPHAGSNNSASSNAAAAAAAAAVAAATATSASSASTPGGPGLSASAAAQGASHATKQYLLLRLSSPCVLRTIRFGKYHKSHVTALREFKVYAGPSRHAASMTRILRDSCRDDGKAQDFNCRYTDDDGVPFAVRYVRIEPLNGHGVHYNFSIWHIALLGISDPYIVQGVQHEYELHHETKSTRLILKHLRARAHQSAFRALLISSHLGRPLRDDDDDDDDEPIDEEGGPHRDLVIAGGVRRQRQAQLVGRGARPFEHPVLSHLFRALTRRDAWDKVERLLQLAAFGYAGGSERPVSHLGDLAGAREHRSGKQRALDGPPSRGRHEYGEEDEEGDVLFAHFVSRTVPRSVWTPMPVRRALPASGADARPNPNIPARPGPRAGHQMVLDSVNSVVYLFGGWDGLHDLADFWAYDIERASWRCISMDTSQGTGFMGSRGEGTAPYGLGHAGPSARSCHRMVFDPRTQCIYLLGRFVEFPTTIPARSMAALGHGSSSSSRTVAAAAAAAATMTRASISSGNQIFQDVMIPSTNLRSHIATTANPGAAPAASGSGSNSNPSLIRHASTAALHSTAQLGNAAAALSASNNNANNAFSATSAASSPGIDYHGPATVRLNSSGGGALRSGAGAGPGQGPHGSSSLNPSPAPGASGPSFSRNLASPGAPHSRSHRAAAGSGANVGESLFPAGGRGGAGAATLPGAAAVHSTSSGSRTLPDYECDFWRFSTRSQTWTRLSADTSVDDGSGTGSPGPRLVKDHAMCIDSEEQALYLFGGRIAHPNSTVIEYGGMWKYDIIRRTWTLLFDDEMHGATGGGCIAGREGHCMLFDPNLTSSAGGASATSGVMGTAAALSASRSGPGALLWILAGKRDLSLADIATYNVRTGAITHVTSAFYIPHGPKPAFTPQCMIDPRPSKREIYFLSALGDRESGAAGDCTSLKMWVYSIERKVWTSVLEPEAASTNAALAAAAAAAAAASSAHGGGRIGADGRPSVRIGPGGSGLEFDGDEYGMRGGTGSPFNYGGSGGAGGSGGGGGGAGLVPKRQRRRDTLESEFEADEDARARLMLSSPPPSGPLHALPFPSTSARRDEAMMMLMETEGEDVSPAMMGATSGGGGTYAGAGGTSGRRFPGGGGGSSSSNMAHSADLYAGLEPRPRWAAQMVHDPLREAFYLFGGNPNGGDEIQLAGSGGAAAAVAAIADGVTEVSRVRARLDDWWKLVLVRPSVEEVLRKTKFLVRKQRFLEMAAGSWERQQQQQQQQYGAHGGTGTGMDLEMSTTSDYAGGGARFSGPQAVEALIYLQTQVSAVVDHADEAESHDFRRLMSKLLSGGAGLGFGGGPPSGGGGGGGGFDSPSHGSAGMEGDVSIDGFIGAAPSHRTRGSGAAAHRRKMRKKNGRGGSSRRRSGGGGGGGAAKGAVPHVSSVGSMDVDSTEPSLSVEGRGDTSMDSSEDDEVQPGAEGYGRTATGEVGAPAAGEEEEEDELEDDEDDGDFEEDEEEEDDSFDQYASERELLLHGKEGQPTELWTQRVRLFRTLMDYFPPDCVEPRADLVDLTLH